MGSPKTIYCYFRVSTEVQAEIGSSLKNQSQQATNIGRRKNIKVVKINEGPQSSQEHISARPKFAQLMKDVEDDKVKHIWVERIDRLYRDYMQQMFFAYHFIDMKGGTIYTGQNCDPVRFDTAQDRMMFKYIALQSESENEMRSERSRLGKLFLLESVAPKKAVYLGGTPTFGYTNKNKEWVIEKSEAKIVKKIFNDYVKGKSIINIKQDLDSSGVQPRRAKYWNLETLRKMLHNESYTGLKEWREFKRNPNNKKEKILVNTRYYKIPKIITTSLYKRAVKKLEKTHLNPTANANKKFVSMLDGLLTCSCGMAFGSTLKNYTRGNTSYVTKLYYCVSRERLWKKLEKENTCDNHRALNMEKADQIVLDAVKKVYQDSNVLKDTFKKSVLDLKKKTPKQIKKDTDELDKKITELQNEIDNLSKSSVETEYRRIKGELPANVATGVIKKIQKDTDEMNKQISKYQDEINKIDTHGEWLDWVKRYSTSLDKINTPQKQNEFIKGLVDKIIITRVSGYNREKKPIQSGHQIDIYFKLKIVNDQMVYKKPKKKSAGYRIIEGKRKIRIMVDSVDPKYTKSVVKQGKKK